MLDLNFLIWTVPLKSQRGCAVVEYEDYLRMSKMKWHFSGGYAKHGRLHYMHILVVGDVPNGMVVDHINGNTLDNRKRNLRIATISENTRNARKCDRHTTSQYKGVFRRENGSWVASIRVEGKQVKLGDFTSELTAAEAYDDAAIQCFGVFAKLNFPNRETNAWVRNKARPRKCSNYLFAGVTKHRSKYRAKIRCLGKVYTSRSYETQEEAAIAYDQMAKRLLGSSARLNFPDLTTQIT